MQASLGSLQWCCSAKANVAATVSMSMSTHTACFHKAALTSLAHIDPPQLAGAEILQLCLVCNALHPATNLCIQSEEAPRRLLDVVNLDYLCFLLPHWAK
jgi:hypothetical protein